MSTVVGGPVVCSRRAPARPARRGALLTGYAFNDGRRVVPSFFFTLYDDDGGSGADSDAATVTLGDSDAGAGSDADTTMANVADADAGVASETDAFASDIAVTDSDAGTATELLAARMNQPSTRCQGYTRPAPLITVGQSAGYTRPTPCEGFTLVRIPGNPPQGSGHIPPNIDGG